MKCSPRLLGVEGTETNGGLVEDAEDWRGLAKTKMDQEYSGKRRMRGDGRGLKTMGTDTGERRPVDPTRLPGVPTD